MCIRDRELLASHEAQTPNTATYTKAALQEFQKRLSYGLFVLIAPSWILLWHLLGAKARLTGGLLASVGPLSLLAIVMLIEAGDQLPLARLWEGWWLHLGLIALGLAGPIAYQTRHLPYRFNALKTNAAP